VTRKTKESLWGLSLDTTTPRSLEYERFYNKQRKEVRRTADQVDTIYRNFKRSQGRKLEGLESSVAELVSDVWKAVAGKNSDHVKAAEGWVQDKLLHDYL